ncbi:MAG: PilZ domain-containing protein [Magnetococcales bacterium]|nr:PilZ domain-containing protein [Magnetococcales bacterium]
MDKSSPGKPSTFDILQRAVRESVLLEVRLDGEEKYYGARLLLLSEDSSHLKKKAADLMLAQFAAKIQPGASEPPQEPKEEPWIQITPLEPPDGNMRIRKAAKVLLGFCLGLEYFRTVVTFRKVQRIETGQAIELSWPPGFQVATKRFQQRVEIPNDMLLEVQVQKRGAEPFSAQVVDISQGGLSFTCNMPSVALESGDRIGVSIRGEILMGTPINTHGTVTTITKARDSKDVQVSRQLYGVQFVMLSVADAMTVDRLVEAVESAGQGTPPKGGKYTRKRVGV